MRQAPDGCLVPTEPLAEIVRGFVARWNRDRPQPGGQFGEGGVYDPMLADVSPMRAAEWLALEATRCSAGWTVVSESTVQSIISIRYQRTELRIADAICQALGRHDVFLDGTLPIVPNPSAPAAARESCCGGSAASPEAEQARVAAPA